MNRSLQNLTSFLVLAVSAGVAPVAWAQNPPAPSSSAPALFRVISADLPFGQRDPGALRHEVLRNRYVALNLALIDAKAHSAAAADSGPNSGRLRLQLNVFDDVSLMATLSPAPKSADGNTVSWTGTIDGQRLSSVAMAITGDVTSGDFRTADGHVYQLRTVASGLFAVREIDQQRFPPDGQPIPVDASRSSAAGAATGWTATARDDGSIIDVMVVYTPAAQAAAGGQAQIENLIDLAFTVTNQGYANSGVTQRVRLAHKEPISYFERGSDVFNNALVDLAGTGDPYMTGVHALRNTYAADMVSLFIDDSALCGLAYLMQTESAAFASSAFSVVNQACAASNFSFAHEMGHNQGSAHDRLNADTGVKPYSFGYCSPTGNFRTIMAYQGASCANRVNYWSNPNVNYNGATTGIASNLSNSADNRLSLNDTRVTASNWRASLTVTPSMTINDPSVAEGNSGTKSLAFTVTLSAAATSTVTVQYATADSTDTYPANSGSDYTAASGTVTFAVGETSKTINVTITGDTRFEPNETFVVNLSSASGATISDNQGKGTITNDDSRQQSVYQAFFAVDTLETPYVGDFNGDNKTDIITFTRNNPSAFGDVYVALSTGTSFGSNTKWHDFFAISTDETVVIGDYDGDNKDDIATWLGKTSRQVYVAKSTGTGMTTETVWVNSIGSTSTDYLASGDANGDGKDDLIMFARTEGKVYVAISDGTKFGTPTVWHPFFAVSTYERPRVADVNGDGKADIVTFATDSPTAFGDVYVAVSNGTSFRDSGGGQNSDKWHDFFAIRPTEEIRVGDINADSKTDFFTFLPAPFAQCYTVLSQGTSMASNVLWPQDIGGLNTDKIFTGDVNGDGKADIIIFAQSEGKVYVSLAS